MPKIWAIASSLQFLTRTFSIIQRRKIQKMSGGAKRRHSSFRFDFCPKITDYSYKNYSYKN
ncbi:MULTISPECIES: hypothetical protein [Pseudanabaena]|uniref:Uncharacterized protein n=1 Tax=Pseudanabaena catenata USMAC16 TaxID=1855837 RepID=A0A9X4MFX6_9CYAN|nr:MULTISPECIES: hypothetical protein [Pseudanabaena]MDG3497096.1 hypothetical protein [Pseudanabaena catenata USMAC16]